MSNDIGSSFMQSVIFFFRLYNYHIDVNTKWPPLLRWHSEMHFWLDGDVWIADKNSLFCCKVRQNNIPASVQIMGRNLPGDKSLSEPMMVSFLTHACVTRPQWVNTMATEKYNYITCIAVYWIVNESLTSYWCWLNHAFALYNHQGWCIHKWVFASL